MLHLFFQYYKTYIESDVENMIKKIFVTVFLALSLLIISTTPVKADDLFKVAITGVTDSSNGATSNYLNYTDTSVNFITELYLPGDSMTYEINVKNSGNIDAILKSINVEKTYNQAISVEYTGIKEGDILKTGENLTFKVLVAYNKDVSVQPTNLTSEFKMSLNYEQNSNAPIIVPGTEDDDEVVDILGVKVPNTVAYISLYTIIVGLLLVIIAFVVLKRTVSEKEELARAKIISTEEFLDKINNPAEILETKQETTKIAPTNLDFLKPKSDEEIEILDLDEK